MNLYLAQAKDLSRKFNEAWADLRTAKDEAKRLRVALKAAVLALEGAERDLLQAYPSVKPEGTPIRLAIIAAEAVL